MISLILWSFMIALFPLGLSIVLDGVATIARGLASLRGKLPQPPIALMVEHDSVLSTLGA